MAPCVPLRWRPDHASEPCAHHGSATRANAQRAVSYEYTTPALACRMGLPFGRALTAVIVILRPSADPAALGEGESNGRTDMGGKLMAAFLTFLFRARMMSCNRQVN